MPWWWLVMAGLALIVLGFGLLVAWLVWAIDSCDGGER